MTRRHRGGNGRRLFIRRPELKSEARSGLSEKRRSGSIIWMPWSRRRVLKLDQARFMRPVQFGIIRGRCASASFGPLGFVPSYPLITLSSASGSDGCLMESAGIRSRKCLRLSDSIPRDSRVWPLETWTAQPRPRDRVKRVAWLCG